MDKTQWVSFFFFFDLQLFKEVNSDQQPSETLIKPLLSTSYLSEKYLCQKEKITHDLK